MTDFISNNWSFLKGKTVMITGANGYIAGHLLNILLEQDCVIYAVARSFSDAILREESQHNYISCDLSNDKWLEYIERVDYLFYFAWQTDLNKADKDVVFDCQNNILPILKLLQKCKDTSHHLNVIFASTVTILGLPDRLPVNENAPDNPLSIYDLHKKMAEQYFSYYRDRGDIGFCSLRLANVYGLRPAQNVKNRGILDLMIHRALNNEDLMVYGDGLNLRDYIYIEDVVEAFLLAAKHIKTLKHPYYFIGSNQAYQLKDAFSLVAKIINNEHGSNVQVKHIDIPSGQSPVNSRNYCVDYSLFKIATGWEPKVKLADGISRSIKYCDQEKKHVHT